MCGLSSLSVLEHLPGTHCKSLFTCSLHSEHVGLAMVAEWQVCLQSLNECTTS
jgi:hypothetical protein